VGRGPGQGRGSIRVRNCDASAAHWSSSKTHLFNNIEGSFSKAKEGTIPRFALAICLFFLPAFLPAQDSCPVPVGNPDGNYVVPGSLGDTVYQPGLAPDAYAPRGPAPPAALVICGRNGNRRGYMTNVYEQLTRDGYTRCDLNHKNGRCGRFMIQL